MRQRSATYGKAWHGMAWQGMTICHGISSHIVGAMPHVVQEDTDTSLILMPSHFHTNNIRYNIIIIIITTINVILPADTHLSGSAAPL